MPRKSRPSDMRHKVEFYKQVNLKDFDSGETEVAWKYDFSLFCKISITFREQLETVYSGSNTLRNRLEAECRFTNKITSAHRALYKGQLYSISIAGDTDGKSDVTRFIMETLEEGGI